MKYELVNFDLPLFNIVEHSMFVVDCKPSLLERLTGQRTKRYVICFDGYKMWFEDTKEEVPKGSELEVLVSKNLQEISKSIYEARYRN